jgi:hypothetical protein
MSPTKKRPIKKIIIKNQSFSLDSYNSLPKLNTLKKYCKRNDFYCIGGNISFNNNQYYSDLFNYKDNKNDNNITNEQIDMESADIKIKKLAKDLNLFQNDKKDKIISFNKILNNNVDEGNNNILPIINNDNSYNNSPKRKARVFSGTNSPRLYSGIVISDSEKLILRKNLNNLKIDNLSFPSFLNNRFKIKKESTPLSQKEKDSFLYKNIFHYFDEKKYPTILKKYINNKINLCYAENEKQFENKIIQMNENNKKKGKSVIFKLGKGEAENKADSLQGRIEFIKKVVDYAYSDIMIHKIKSKSYMEKRGIKEKNLEQLKKERELKEKLRLKKYYKDCLLHDSIKIQKI